MNIILPSTKPTENENENEVHKFGSIYYGIHSVRESLLWIRFDTVIDRAIFVHFSTISITRKRPNDDEKTAETALLPLLVGTF